MEGQIPWSIRQTAMYQRLSPVGSKTGSHDPNCRPSTGYRSAFLFVAPSQAFESELDRCGIIQAAESNALCWQNAVRLLVQDSAKGWPEYIAWMEERIKEQVCEPLTLSNVTLRTFHSWY